MGRPLNGAERFYGRWAPVYDLVATSPLIRAWRERAVDSLDLSGGETVVDMGCGTGANFPHLQRAVGPEGRVVGVDLVPEMLTEAERRTEATGWENVHVVRGDATRPPIDAADAILSTFVVGMFPDPKPVVRTWFDVVEAGGRVTLCNATRTTRTAARPLNALFRVYVRFTNAGTKWRIRSPVHLLDARWATASDTLLEGTVDHRRERGRLGFLTLASGRLPE